MNPYLTWFLVFVGAVVVIGVVDELVRKRLEEHKAKALETEAEVVPLEAWRPGSNVRRIPTQKRGGGAA